MTRSSSNMEISKSNGKLRIAGRIPHESWTLLGYEMKSPWHFDRGVVWTSWRLVMCWPHLWKFEDPWRSNHFGQEVQEIQFINYSRLLVKLLADRQGTHFTYSELFTSFTRFELISCINSFCQLIKWKINIQANIQHGVLALVCHAAFSGGLLNHTCTVRFWSSHRLAGSLFGSLSVKQAAIHQETVFCLILKQYWKMLIWCLCTWWWMGHLFFFAQLDLYRCKLMLVSEFPVHFLNLKLVPKI